MSEKFQRYQREHARLHDPEVLHSSVELVPLELEQMRSSVDTGKNKRRDKRKKKKFAMRHDLPSGDTTKEHRQAKPDTLTDEELSDPFSHLSLTAYVKWLENISSTPTNLTTDNVFEVRSDESEQLPDIVISPLTLGGYVDLFQDLQFEINTPDTQQAQLVWQEISGYEVRKVVMDHKRLDLFQTTVGLEDGDYIFGYNIDGHMRLDPHFAQSVVMRLGGIWARLKLGRQERLVELHNRGNVGEAIRVESGVPWLLINEDVRIPPGGRIPVTVKVKPREMTIGINEGLLRVLARRNGQQETVSTVGVEIIGRTQGAIPVVRYHPQQFGWIIQGKESLEVSVEITSRGQGSLSGMLMVRPSQEVFDIRLDPAEVASKFSRTIIIDSTFLPYRAQAALSVTLISDSYLANYRLFQVELPYGLIYLAKSLPALSFGRVRKGMTRTLRLDVERSDGKDVNLAVSIPERASNYLEAYRARHDAYSFRFDTRDLAPGTIVNEVITLFEQSSGLSDTIKVIAEVGNQHLTQRVPGGRAIRNRL